jgi:hypothetical protein
LTVSTNECTASLSMAAEPVTAAARNFDAATSRLPARAAQTAALPLFAMMYLEESRRPHYIRG